MSQFICVLGYTYEIQSLNMNTIKKAPDTRDNHEHTDTASLHNIEALQYIQVLDDNYLRPLEVSDAPDILQILSADPSIRDRVSVASAMHIPEDVQKQVKAYKQDHHCIRYAIVEGDTTIGLVSFWRDVDSPFDAPDNPDDYGFGYFLDPSQRSRGIITAAVESVMSIGTQSMHVNQFIAYCEDDNKASIAVLTKLGFRHTDTTLVEEKK